MEVYARETEPLLDYYRERDKLITVEGTESKEMYPLLLSELAKFDIVPDS